MKGKVLGRRRLAGIGGIVTPDTILRWYRTLVAKKYDGSNARRHGRPSTKADLAALVVRMATENPTWSYTRIRGGLKSLGHDIGRNTIKAILKDYGIEPAPERGTKISWKTFLAAHWDGLAAADFFTVEVLTPRGLVRYIVFFVMKLKTRTVEIAGINSQPDEVWMTQVARNLTAASDGFLRGMQYVILDRDPLYTAAFRRLEEQWCHAARPPGVESQFERVYRTVCRIRQVRVLGANGAPRRSLSPGGRSRICPSLSSRTAASGSGQRAHPTNDDRDRKGRVKCRERLGGLLKFYNREAA